MDDTQQSRVSDAATRKRRSSILKSQRPPRTPFCELEFNVCTPPDTTKSRRVSFSRRTGVAEFVTNEATTTWKNFYEEHNKSLEHSGNDSKANDTKPTVSHLGKRLFDEQFEEVEVIDFAGEPSHDINVNQSIKNANFTLECTDKLPAPENNFELSAFTEQKSKVFVDDLIIPGVGEVSECIDINFSAIKKLGVKDDLDEIQQDLQRQNNVGCHGPFNERQNMSEYIEVDLDMTQVAVRHEESDMSITDLIHIPKVQDISKKCSIDKKVNVDKDWVADKENIAMNPYVAPKESLNFAINEEPDKVLVFDGKKLIVQSENPKPPQRKTIVLNCNDDLPNFLESSNLSRNVSGFVEVKHNGICDNILSNLDEAQKNQTTIIYEDDLCNISITKAAHPSDFSLKRRTVLYENDMGNKSATQSLPLNIVENLDITRTVVYENESGNISITKAFSGNILPNLNQEKTVVYEKEGCNISVTQALPSNIIAQNVSNKHKTLLYDDNTGNMSVTHAIPNTVIKENAVSNKRGIIVYDNDTGNISVTQAISNNIVLIENPSLTERRKTIVYENDTGNISVTQAVPQNIIIPQEIKPTVITADVDISMTEAVPTNIKLGEVCETSKCRTISYNNETGDISVTQGISDNQIITHTNQHINISNDIKKGLQNNSDTNKRRTIVFESEGADISVTQGVNFNQLLTALNIRQDNEKNDTNLGEEINVSLYPNLYNKRNTIVFDNDNANVSITQAVITKQLISEISKSHVQDNNSQKDIEEATNTALHVMGNRRRTILYEDDGANISITQAIPANILLPEERRRTLIPENNISAMQEIPAHIIAENRDLFMEIDKLTDISSKKNLDVSGTTLDEKGKCFFDTDTEISEAQAVSQKENTNQSTIHSLFDKTNNSPNSKLNFNNKDDTLKPVSDILVYQAVTMSGQKQEVTANDKDNVENQELRTDSNGDDMSCSNIIENDLNSRSSQVNQQNVIIPNIITLSELRYSDVEMAPANEKQSVMNELLDMSSSTAVAGSVGDEVTTKLSQNSPISTCKSDVDTNTSDDTLFYITTDTDRSMHRFAKDMTRKLNSRVGQEIEGNNIVDIQSKISEIKTALREQRNGKNRHFENIYSSDIEKEKSLDKTTKDTISKGSKSFQSANDTNELLEILSDFTDIPKSKTTDQNLKRDEEYVKPAIMLKGHLALENKSEDTEPESRIIYGPKRRSIALSREDLFNNLSFATAALRKSRMELDESEDMEDTKETLEKGTSLKKSVRLSTDVVKTLQFDDELNAESSVDTKQSPLKKTAFGEISYMKEVKTKVIPDYMNDVTVGIKELMNDLVKPMADVLPYDSTGVDRHAKRVPSTCSTQIQANLITTSQIDITSGLCSNPESVNEMNKISSVDIISDAVQRSVIRSMKFPISTNIATSPSNKSIDSDMVSEHLKVPPRTLPFKPCEVEPQGHVLIFDHNNPLNNILLAPPGALEVHKYNPRASEEKIDAQETELDCELERVSTQYRVESTNLKAHVYQRDDSQSDMSNVSKTMSIDRATEAIKNEIVNTEVNTVIAMKPNRELLEASSSLTLVDDARRRNEFDVHMDTSTSIKKDNSDPPSPVRVIYKGPADTPAKLDSDFTSNDELGHERLTKAKKRMYSPGQRDIHKHMFTKSEITPKPVSKMQKISVSPEYKSDYADKSRLQPEKDESLLSIQTNLEKRSSKKPKSKKPGTTITVQQLMTEYNVRDVDHDSLKSMIKGVLTDQNSDISSLDNLSSSLSKVDVGGVGAIVVSSCTSSKNMRDDESTVSHALSTKSSCSDWHTEVQDTASMNVITDSDSGVNVVARIDMLPFMGSSECEWESCSGDTWSFRLLHARLRLRVRLAHRHDNAPRTLVRADTPIKRLTLDVATHEKKSALSSLCVQLAADTMRWAMASGCGTAGELPALVKRLAAVSRMAVRWARAMHDARLRLAYTLAHDGHLSLKVANIPLRSVWEVTMQIELSGARPPHPRAADVQVARVCSDTGVTRAELTRLLSDTPEDWSHVPRTIWRVFKYLKNKPRDDFAILNA